MDMLGSSSKQSGKSIVVHCSLEVADSVVIPQNLNKFERKMGYKSVKKPQLNFKQIYGKLPPPFCETAPSKAR